jgi:hypothetical protein
MSQKVRIENTTDAAIYLPVGANHAVVIIPRAVKKKVHDEKTGDDHMVTTNGAGEVDSEQLAEFRKTNKIAASYFADGHLKEVGSGPPPNSSSQGNSPKTK